MEDTKSNKQTEDQDSGLSRRDIIKGLATIPFVGGAIYGAYRKRKYEPQLKSNLLSGIGIDVDPGTASPQTATERGQQIRLGIIGFGIRGKQLVRASGFATDAWMEIQQERARTGNDIALKTFLEQDDLNIVYNGVCDIFDVESESALKTVSINGHKAKKYHNWEELVHADDIDAVIIATPDHWHAPMAIEAAKAGKHVYVENH